MSDYIQIANIRGTPNRNIDAIEMILDDFYTLCCKNPKHNIGLRLNSRKHELLVFNADDVSLEYLCSDFVRFCLSLYKNNSAIARGETKIIPKRPIPISKELKQYIREFLPDFYDNRTN
jgi:hypothetical protein